MKNSLAKMQQIFLHDMYHGTLDASAFLNSAIPKEHLEIYINNTQLTLIDLLRNVYPVIYQIVGTDFFNTLARRYLQQYVLSDGNRFEYGSEFANFLKSYPPETLPYLSDLARLEWAYHIAYKADDAQITNFEKLQQLVNTENDFSLALHPSVQIISVDYNVLNIWQAHQTSIIETIYLQQYMHDILIFRDVKNTIYMKPISSASAKFLLTSPNSFSSALQLIDVETFQIEFAEYIVQGVFVDRCE